MAIDQQETSNSNITSPNSSNIAQVGDSSSVHDVENPPPGLLDQHHQQRFTSQFSVLYGTLRPVTLKFEDVTYCIKLSTTNNGYCSPRPRGKTQNNPKQTRTILNGVTGIVRPGELLAMLGPSGSGKTTLLTSLAGRLTSNKYFKGSITYNNQPFSSSIKRNTGFVTQDDILYPHLTVLETLTYAALLKLPNKLTKLEKKEQAEMIILQLGLTRCRNSLVGSGTGSVGLRGISGGERKRVSIGQEMLVNPSLLFLDEPTSGLDSTTAQRIMATLKGLARGGRTIVTTIHQPSSRLYKMFDKVVVLCDGCPIYSGKGDKVMEYFGSIGFLPPCNFVNPADFLLDLATGITSEVKQQQQEEDEAESCDQGRWNSTVAKQQPDLKDANSTKQLLISFYKKNLYPELKAQIQKHQIRPTSTTTSSTSSYNVSGESTEWTTTWWEQFKVLLKRGLKERRHESYSTLRIFQVLSVSFLSGLLWYHSNTSHIQDQVGLLFFFSIFWSFFPLFNSIFAFPQERPMLIRERGSSMYRLSSYYFARTAGDLPMELVLPTIFTTITYWMSGLKPSPYTFMLTLLIILYNVMVSQGLGLALGAILMEVKQATTLASVILLMFLLAGGYYIQHIPGFIAWLKYVSFSHYCYKLLVGVQYEENEVYDCGSSVSGVRWCKVLDFQGIKFLGIGNLGYDVVVLTVMLVVYRVLAYLALRRLSQPQ